ncbi:hypothetical protein C1N80_08540 [Brachybacterium sp. SGAir0954]|uniref:glycosyltransferase n=1 Tax=Brachybacterium sp. SGAir0954 TaxID=2571029 RepID=UPI0010CD0560|nr:glycosyltransferase [Brachybacterium sp. SGAir0954]QCR53623.1 hypothetical protein C1N80_08540 [Brachybacterium sp. SGAir0954]
MTSRRITAVVLLSGTSSVDSSRAAVQAVRDQTNPADLLVAVAPAALDPEVLTALEGAAGADHLLTTSAGVGRAGALREALDLLDTLTPASPDDDGDAAQDPATADATLPSEDQDADGRGASSAGRRAADVDVDELERRRTQEAEDLARVPERLRRRRRRGGRRAAAADRDDWLWIVEDGSLPSADALEQQLALLTRSPSTAVVGTKRVRHEDAPGEGRFARAATLVDVGLSLSRTGRIVTGVDPGEIDQGQSDWRHDVLAVALSGMLVRERTLRELGGLDPVLPAPWAEIDLCQRVWRAGERVVVQPAARTEVPAPSTPFLERLQEQRTGRILVQLKHRPLPAAVLLLVLLPLITLLRMAGDVAAVQPRRLPVELRAWASAMHRAPGVMRRGMRARHRARVPRGRLAPLYLPLGESLRRTAADVWNRLFADDDRTRRIRRTTWGIAGTRHGIDDADYGRHVVWTAVVALASVVLGLVSLRALFGRGELRGPGLLALPADWRATWEAAWSSWIPGGLGTRGPADPLIRLLGHLPVDGDLLVEAIVFASVPVAALAAWWAAGAITRAIGARLALTVAWALAPVLLTGLVAGAWPLLLVHALLPLLALAVGRAIGLPHKISQASVSAAAAAGLLLLVIGAVQPVLVLVAALGLALLAPAVRGRRWRLLWVLVPSLALHLPYLGVYADAPRTLLAVGGMPATGPGLPDVDAVRSALAPLAGLTGPTAAAFLPLLPLLPLVPVVLGALVAPFLAGPAGRAGRFSLLLAAAVLAAGQIARSVAVAVDGDRVVTAELLPLLSVLLLALSVGAAASFDALARRDATVSGPRRTLTTVLAAGVAAACLVTVVGWTVLLPGLLEVERTEAVEVPAAAADQGLTDARTRVLTLTQDEDGAVSAGLVVHGGESALQRAGVADARDVATVEAGEQLGADPGSTALRTWVAGLVSGEAGAADEAATSPAVSYVLVPGDPAAQADLVAALDSSPALEKVTVSATGGLWRVVEAPARAVVRSADDATPLASTVVDARGTVAAAPAERTVVLAERYDTGWTATLDGERLEPTLVDGWSQGFVLPACAEGDLEVGRSTPWRPLWQVLLYAGTGLTALIAIPWRARTRSAEELHA